MTISYLDLTPAQRESLDILPFDGNHLVSGPPGSGKSLLAAQRAVMLSLTGTPTVLLTRSNLLRQELLAVVARLGGTAGGGRTPRGGVQVATAHAWLSGWYGRDAPQTDDGWFDWPAFYTRAATVDSAPVPAVVVDEGQDLPPAFYRLCRVLGARTTVYADECQRLTDTHSTLADITRALGCAAAHEVRGNHRNTRQIAELAAEFHIGAAPPELPSREGSVPRLHRFAGAGALVELVVSLAERQPARSIGVVLGSTRAQLDLLTRLERRAPRLRPQLYTSQATSGRYRTLDLTRPGVVIAHRASAKGLGFDTVVVPDLHVDADKDPTSAAVRMMYYVLTTRARHELHLGYEGHQEGPLVSAVRPALLLRG
ncbi:hypothetical protein SAMN05216371_2248 [Streptomyces sp. TLI_053]|uniref:DNA helicase n=1 Tax=Streptomyces sp. TLI_053 TaxID=1855352 RepID=UPI00087CA3AD|nr:DNA helicase [Streptomyces sp. TLI_053]SDT42459.1 hypothetical protein SAMN05216371_2248 [Streptomyces sp. TLI_053]